jgi:hypothetical protein
MTMQRKQAQYENLVKAYLAKRRNPKTTINHKLLHQIILQISTTTAIDHQQSPYMTALRRM